MKSRQGATDCCRSVDEEGIYHYCLENTSSKGAVFWVFVSVYSRVWGRHAIQTSNFLRQGCKILASIAVAPQGLLDYTVDLYPVFVFFLFSRAKGGILTNYLFQFARILAFCFLGEIRHAVSRSPPGQHLRPAAALAALRFGIVKLEQVKEVGLFLTGIFPLLFVPAAAAGVMELWAEMGEMLLPIVIAIIR